MADRKKYRIVERIYNTTPSTNPNYTISLTEPPRYYVQQFKRNKWVSLPDLLFLEVWFNDYKTAKNNLDILLKKNKNKKKDYTEKVVYSRKEKLAKLLGKRV